MIILLADRDPRVLDRTITTHDGDIKSLGARGAQPPTACHPIRMRRIQGTQIVVYRKRFRCGKRPEYSVIHLSSRYTVGIFSIVTSACKRPFKRALTSGSYNGENTDCVAGGQVDNAVFWPLSTAEAFAVNNDLRALDPAHPNWVTSSWWLRSPGSKTFYVAIVSSDGSVQYSGISIRKQNNHLTVRPAFNLNLNSVLFTSAAVGGKPDGGLTEVPEYSGNEWKLTLLDSSRNFAVTEKLSAPTPTIPLR